jgi:hypothetical protein
MPPSMQARSLAARLRPFWPQARAVLVTFHCLAIALAAIPTMTDSHPLSAGDPQFATQVHPFARLFGVSDETFASHAESARTSWIAIHGRLIVPLERYLDLVGAQQPWDMFSLPILTPARFSLEVRPRTEFAVNDSENGWQFLSGLPAGSWRRPFFEAERTRSLLNHIGRRGVWALADELCLRLARDALREDDRWAEARCVFASQPSPSPPWSLGTPTGANRWPRVDYIRVVQREP